MDAVYEWLLHRARSPAGKVAAATLISILFCAFAAGESMTSPVGAAMVLGLGAALGLAAGLVLVLIDRAAARDAERGVRGPGCAQRLLVGAVLLGMLLGLILLLFAMVAGVTDAIGGLSGR